jgi:formiminoglutamase
MSDFFPIDPTLLFSKGDKTDIRLGDLVTADSKFDVTIAGYPDDEGIKNNGGRVGASDAPDRIRQYLYKMTPSVWTTELPRIRDFGNLKLTTKDISTRHQQATSAATETLNKKSSWLSFGGGHDYAYADAKAYINFCKFHSLKPLILNFDAHLDVRPVVDKINSGTAFWRIQSEFDELEFAQIGIQSQCNSREHLKWCEDKGARILSLSEIRFSGISAVEKVLSFIEPYLTRKRAAYVSFDMDVMSSMAAPGCSQSWPSGLYPDEALTILSVIFKRLDVRCFGIYEVSPSLDVADMTSKLAAELAHLYISTRVKHET